MGTLTGQPEGSASSAGHAFPGCLEKSEGAGFSVPSPGGISCSMKQEELVQLPLCPSSSASPPPHNCVLTSSPCHFYWVWKSAGNQSIAKDGCQPQLARHHRDKVAKGGTALPPMSPSAQSLKLPPLAFPNLSSMGGVCVHWKRNAPKSWETDGPATLLRKEPNKYR